MWLKKTLQAIKRFFIIIIKGIKIALEYIELGISLFFKYTKLLIVYTVKTIATILHYVLLPISYPISLLVRELGKIPAMRKIFDSKAMSFVKAGFSVIIWGSGQLFNGQKIKAFIFFIIFLGFVGLELGTSNYFVETDAYSKLPGEDFGDDYISSIMGDFYDIQTQNYKINYPAFVDYLDSIGKSGDQIFTLTEDEFIYFIAQDLKANNPIIYTNLNTDATFTSIEGVDVSQLLNQTFYYDQDGQIFYQERTLGDNTKEYVEINLATFELNESNILSSNTNLKTVEVSDSTYQVTENDQDVYYVLVTVDSNSQYLNIADQTLVSSLTNPKAVMFNDSYVKTHIIRAQNMFVDANGIYYTAQDVLGTTAKNYIETDLITGVMNENNILISDDGLTAFNKNNTVYQYDDGGTITYYLEADTFNDLGDPIVAYVNVLTKEVVSELPLGSTEINMTGPMYEINGVYYEYYQPGLVYLNATLSFVGTAFTDKVKESMYVTYNQTWNTYTENDYLRFVIKVYFEIYPDQQAEFRTAFNNFFYDKAGLFVKSYWSVITLGTAHKVELTEYNTLKIALVGDSSHTPKLPITLLPSVPILGHVSAQILIEGLIGIITSLIFFIFMIWSVRDAYKVSEAKRKKEKVLNDKAYFAETFESGFSYFVLSPAMVVLAFISLMPIAFGFIIAFTNIAGRQSLIDTFDYVGFKNFVALFDFNGALGSTFGKAFWRVLGWTVIWAIFSTATVFFGGFFQAIILNSEKVVFRKFWRTVLILPWAIPALLSQMIFKVMFNETGYVNQVFRNIGFYDLFEKWGILGRPFELLNGFEKIFYLGNQNIQWFTNPNNPNFVRIVLIVVNIWLGFPYFMALMTGVMTAIDKTLYEAADIDGASNGQKLTKITMPLVLYSTAPILIMTFSGNFNNFGVIYFITGGGPNANNFDMGYAGDTDILISWMYKLTVDQAIYNMASVFSVLIFFFVGSVTAWNLTKTRAFKED